MTLPRAPFLRRHLLREVLIPLLCACLMLAGTAQGFARTMAVTVPGLASGFMLCQPDDNAPASHGADACGECCLSLSGALLPAAPAAGAEPAFHLVRLAPPSVAAPAVLAIREFWPRGPPAHL